MLAPATGARFSGVLVLLTVTAALLLAGCGGSGSSPDTEATATSGSDRGEVRVVWEKPATAEDALGYELLQASETEGVVNELAETFELPRPLTVRGVNGYGDGPYYYGADNSIVLPYGFAAFALEVMAESSPESSEEELGEQATAVNDFILGHEFAHALIENFGLSVLGKEEDAADSISTALLLDVPGGDEYADTHSLDAQRSLNILCWVAGSSERSFEEVAELEVLPSRGWQPAGTNTNCSWKASSRS